LVLFLVAIRPVFAIGIAGTQFARGALVAAVGFKGLLELSGARGRCALERGAALADQIWVAARTHGTAVCSVWGHALRQRARGGHALVLGA